MNILMALSQKEITGAEVYATTLGDELTRRGHTVSYVSDTLTCRAIGKFVALNFNSRGPFRRIWQVTRLIYIIQKYRIQLVHAHSRAAGWACFIACRLTGTPMVTTVHGRQPVHASRKAFHAFGYRAIAVCEAIREQIIAQLGVADDQVCVIANPIHEKNFVGGQIIKSQLSRPVISIIGRLTGPKGELCFRLLDDVLKNAINEKEVLVRVVSASKIPERFERFQSDVDFLSLPEGISMILNESDLVIGSGRVAIEALISGARLYAIGEAKSCGFIDAENFAVASRSNFGDVGPRELEIDFESVRAELGLFIRHHKAQAENIPGGISHARDSADRRDVRSRLRELALAKFGLAGITDQIESVYQDAHVYTRRREIPILMYHRFTEHDSEKGIHGTWLSVAMFERHLRLLKRLGFESITFKDLAEKGFIHRFSPGRRFVMITADDGYQDNLTRMLPLLKKYGMKAIVYVVSQETHNRWDAEHPSSPDTRVELLTADEIRELDRSGLVEIGGHTLTHANLPELDAREQRHEIVENKRQLEDILGHPVLSFAYPFGDVDESAKREAKAAGYQFAVATDSGPRAMHADCYQIRRIAVFPRTGVLGLWRKVRGNYVWKR